MGIIKRNVSAKSGRSAVTIIAEGNRFHGETTISGKMHVDGRFDGRIDSSDDISIGRAGQIRGQVRAHAVNVSGLFEGDLICDSLHIEKGGRVRGNIYCATLSIDPDGCFVGERRLPGEQRLTWDGQVAAETAVTEVCLSPEVDLIDSLPDRITLSRKG